MKHVVWVVGASAAGKATFIRRVLSDHSLSEKLGLTGRLAASKESLDNIGMHDKDPVVDRREKILEEVPKLLQINDVVLLKWQYVDSQTTRLQRLKALMPTAGHSAIILTATSEELRARRPTKTWWSQSADEDKVIAQELRYIEKHIIAIRKEFDTISLKSDARNGYEMAHPVKL